MKKSAIIVFILLAFASTIFSQNQEDPLGCATEKSGSLAFLVGEWNVKSRFRISKSQNKWENTEAVSNIKHLFKDCVYQELITGTRNERPHQYIGLFSYNNLTDRLQWVGGHSEHGVLTLYEGNFVGDELIFEHEFMLRGSTIHLRLVYSKTKEGFKVRSERSSDKKTWDATTFMEYTRK